MTTLQQVNLLSEALIPKRELLSVKHLTIFCFGFAFVLILASARDGWMLNSLQEQVVVAQGNLDTISTQYEKLQTSQAGGEKALREELEVLQKRRAEQRILAQVLSTDSDQKGLSSALFGLSRSAVEGLWLEEIRIVPTALHLKGKALDAVLLPQYLQALADLERFSGFEFRTVDLELEEDTGYLAFDLRGPANEILLGAQID